MGAARRAAWLALVLILFLAPSALAHADVARSSPRAGASLNQTPTSVWIDFTQPPDPAGSTLEIQHPNRTAIPTGELTVEGDRMTLTLEGDLAPGGYLLWWVALSKSDGHETFGTIPFAIGGAVVPEAQEAVEPQPSVFAIAGKSLLYLGLTAAIGALAFHVWVTPSAHDATWRRIVLLGSIAAAAGTLLFATAIVARASQDPGTYLMRIAFGRGLVLRSAIALLLVASAWITTRRREQTSEWLVRGTFAAALALLTAGAAYSHTATAIHPRAWGITVDALHLAAAFAWTGGLIALASHLRRHDLDPEEMRRVAGNFSALATLSIAVVSIVGLFMLFALTGTTPREWLGTLGTPYGRFLDAKIAAFLVMAALGAANRWRYIAHFEQGRKLDARVAFRRSVRREVAVGVVVLVLAGIATNYSPPNLTTFAEGASAPVAAAPEPTRFEAHGEFFLFDLAFDPPPGTTQDSRAVLRVLEHDTRRPVLDVTKAFLVTSHRTVDIGEATIPLDNEGNGTWAASGRFFTVPGAYRVTVGVNTPTVNVDTANVLVDVA